MSTSSGGSDKIDAYILRQKAFAQPILNYLRNMVKKYCAEAEEYLEWGMPAWLYRGKHQKPGLEMPPAFEAALAVNADAKACFESFPPSQRRKYLDWIISAKREVTSDKRIAQAVERLAEGKRRNWKYENC